MKKIITLQRIRKVEKETGIFPLSQEYLATLEDQEAYLDWLLEKDTSARIEISDF